jgi:hypothetical protein
MLQLKLRRTKLILMLRKPKRESLSSNLPTSSKLMLTIDVLLKLLLPLKKPLMPLNQSNLLKMRNLNSLRHSELLPHSSQLMMLKNKLPDKKKP